MGGPPETRTQSPDSGIPGTVKPGPGLMRAARRHVRRSLYARPANGSPGPQYTAEGLSGRHHGCTECAKRRPGHGKEGPADETGPTRPESPNPAGWASAGQPDRSRGRAYENSCHTSVAQEVAADAQAVVSSRPDRPTTHTTATRHHTYSHHPTNRQHTPTAWSGQPRKQPTT